MSVKSAYGVACEGEVTLYVDKKKLVTVSLDSGKAWVNLPAGYSPGGHVVNTYYLGNDSTYPSQAESTFTVET